MPIICPITIARISEKEMAALDYEVMQHVFAVHGELGCLCDESVYQSRLAQILVRAGFQVELEVGVMLHFRDFVKPLYLDLVVNRMAIYELKTVSVLTAAHRAQLLTYLFVTNATRGKLVNFRPTSIKSEFVNATMDLAERRRFDINTRRWSGPQGFHQLVGELVADWGTGLETSLYHQAIVHCLGGEELVTRQIPMSLGGLPLGNQRFHLLSEKVPFQITTFQETLGSRHEEQLRKLMAPSPFKKLHWVNIARHQVTFTTILL